MVKDSDWNPWRYGKHNHVIIKLAVSILLVGLAFRLFSSTSSGSVRVSEVRESNLSFPDGYAGERSDTQEPDLGASMTKTNKSRGGKCDLFVGDWIYYPSGPRYTNATCQRVEDHQNCMKNGRPDSDYLYWRWKPRDCEVPIFDGEKFLETMRNKSWAFVGDSICRNHVQSFLCLLSQVAEVVDVYHDEEYKSRTWHFPSYNFTVAVIWSPFLAKANIFEDINGISTSEIELHLDVLDKKWIDQFENFDFIVIAGGKWFLKTSIFYEKGEIVGCHYCPKRNLTELGFEYSYRKVLGLVFDYISTSKHNVVTFFRTSTPSHFENGEWFSGGTCKRTRPLKENEISISDMDRILRSLELEQFKKALEKKTANSGKFKLFDTTMLSLLRPDGHPGPYRMFHPFAQDKNAKVQNDCLHWCLPGPIDSWNDILMKMVEDG
ncbi:unnamed protein product [Victoria cruziana]